MPQGSSVITCLCTVKIVWGAEEGETDTWTALDDPVPCGTGDAGEGCRVAFVPQATSKAATTKIDKRWARGGSNMMPP